MSKTQVLLERRVTVQVRLYEKVTEIRENLAMTERTSQTFDANNVPDGTPGTDLTVRPLRLLKTGT